MRSTLCVLECDFLLTAVVAHYSGATVVEPNAAAKIAKTPDHQNREKIWFHANSLLTQQKTIRKYTP